MNDQEKRFKPPAGMWPLRPWEEQCDDCGIIYNRETREGMCLLCTYKERDEREENTRRR